MPGSAKLMQWVGQLATQVPQAVHLVGFTWAREWSMVMAPSGQTLLHLVQPMQPALHTSITALPRLGLEQRSKTFWLMGRTPMT